MKKSILFFFVIYLISILNLSSQVTIGSIEEPNAGAILDLKEWPQADGGVNATRGLILPRIDLIKTI